MLASCTLLQWTYSLVHSVWPSIYKENVISSLLFSLGTKVRGYALFLKIDGFVGRGLIYIKWLYPEPLFIKNCLYVSPLSQCKYGGIWFNMADIRREIGERSGFLPYYMIHDLLTSGDLQDGTVTFYLDSWDTSYQELSNDTHNEYILGNLMSTKRNTFFPLPLFLLFIFNKEKIRIHEIFDPSQFQKKKGQPRWCVAWVTLSKKAIQKIMARMSTPNLK